MQSTTAPKNPPAPAPQRASTTRTNVRRRHSRAGNGDAAPAILSTPDTGAAPPTKTGNTMTNFTVIGRFSAFVRRSSLETSPEPYEQPISARMLFAPTFTGMIASEQQLATFKIAPMLARLVEGVVMNVAGLPTDTTIPKEQPGELPDYRRYGVRLVANDFALGPLVTLEYHVSFDGVVYGGKTQQLAAFNFEAPREDIVIDLATVTRTRATSRA